jgi:3-deoxy-7-phosphoheptulonate synthase
MLIQLTEKCSGQELQEILASVERLGYKPSAVKTQYAEYIICVGRARVDIRLIGNLPGVRDVHVVGDPSKLVSRLWKVETTEIPLGGDMKISRQQFTIGMGPCSIENEEQVVQMVAFLKKNGIKLMRGGIFKPRSSPYSFRGLGIDGLKTFSRHCKANGIRIVSEVMQVSQIEEMHDYVDIFQVGTRNAQNFNLLDELGKVDKPVLLKRGMSSTLDELLASAEYIFSNGNEKIILCERGIRTFEKAYRNTLDLNAIPYLKEKSHLPVFSDPSHGVGVRAYVEYMALASVMAGADGLLIEIHDTPERAISDGDQSLNLAEAERAVKRIKETVKFRESLNFA